MCLFYRLTDDVLWFEPPTVCRWETYDETEISIEATERMQRENPFFKMMAESSQQTKPENGDKSEHDDGIDVEGEGGSDKDKTEMIEHDDEDETIKMISETFQSDKVKTRVRDKTKSKKIRDFNLFEIPRKINLHDLMLNFVVPRLPDGYGIRMQMENRERRGSVMRYLKGF